MIARREHLLLPASRAFIAFTIITAFVLNILPWGRYYFVPDFLALVFVFWSIHEPRKVGMGIAFVFGLLMDVHNANLLGEHALAYTLLSFGGIALHRRVQFFPLGSQMLHILPLLIGAHVALMLVSLIAGRGLPEFTYFLQPVVTALMWPLADLILLAPQRRAVDRDDDRPL
jgi:rod shape-determining protein MreD